MNDRMARAASVGIGCLAVLLVAALDEQTMAPFAASACLAVAQPPSPVNRPRAQIGGYLVCVTVGLVVGAVSHGLIAGAVAGALAASSMVAGDVLHPPAAAAAYLVSRRELDAWFLVRPTLLGAIVLVAAGFLARGSSSGKTPWPWQRSHSAASG